MRIAMALLADAANVRDGLISVLSAGITQLNREAYPAPFGVRLALVLEVHPADGTDEQRVIALKVTVVPVGENKDSIAELEGELGYRLEKPQVTYLPFPLDFTPVAIPEPGEYLLHVNVDGLEPVTIPFRAELTIGSAAG